MKNNKGFTLTEILLAVMIVGVIGVALAALTTASVRESGVGRTRAVLRGQLSIALRQLRQDILQSTDVSANGGNLRLTQSAQLGPDHVQNTISYVFEEGKTAVGGGAKIGGRILRNEEVWLDHVKSISDGTFTSPEFALEDSTTGGIESRLRVRIIVEVPSEPIVNDVIDETFVLPHGFAIRQMAGN